MKKILITGGTGSLGQAFIVAFAEKGDYEIEFTYYSNEKLANELSSKYKAKAIKLTSISDIDDNYDIIINNAGIVNAFTQTENVTMDDWNKAIEVNLTLPFLIIKKVLPYMKSKKWGRIINISSIYGIKSEEELLPYNVSKHGLIGLTQTVAKEYADDGITCNALCPETIKSDMVEKVANIYAKTAEEKKKYYEEMINENSAKRLLEPSEVAEAALTLINDNSNGLSIIVDGLKK